MANHGSPPSSSIPNCRADLRGRTAAIRCGSWRGFIPDVTEPRKRQTSQFGVWTTANAVAQVALRRQNSIKDAMVFIANHP